MTTIIEAPQIAVPLQATFLDAVDKGRRGPRNKCRYTEDEKKVLEPYKEEYRKTTTTSERHNIIRNHILVDIFNFWYEKGIVTPSIGEEALSERIKV
jgi:hypothetical protein